MTITLHHLRFSRSTRIIWLLEELGADYKIIEHHRDAQTHRSQEDMAAVHPLAKAPIIEANGQTIIESGAIIEYLCEIHGDKLAIAANHPERAAYLQWLHFAEGSLAMPMLMTLLGPRFGDLDKLPIMNAFISGEVNKLLDYINDHLKARDYLLGNDFTSADINIEYLLELGNMAGLLANRPHAAAYLTRLMQRDAYKKAIVIGGPLTPG